MQVGLGLALTHGGGAHATSVLTSIDGPTTATSGSITGYTEGWVGRSTTATPGTSTIRLTRQGFTAAAAVTSYTDTLTVTQQLRQVYPIYNLPAAGMYALSDAVYSTDIVDGGACVNSSTFTSPKPVANWSVPDRFGVGDSIGGTGFPVRLTAWHRNARGGKPVACVVFTISDGTPARDIPVTVTGVTVPGMTGDLYTVQEYVLPTTDISSLADNVTLTINAKVYPWIGDATNSVLDSAATGADLDGFSPRYYRRDKTRFGADGLAQVPVAYVSSSGATPAGNDGTGVWSPTPATAAATPFLTIAGAMAAIGNASRGVPVDGGGTRSGDGCEIRLTGTFALTTNTSFVQKCARVTVTRDSGTAKASAVMTFGAAAFSFATSGAVTVASKALRFYDITLQRTGANIMSGSGAKGVFQWENVILDPNGTTATLLGNANDYVAVYGLTALSAVGGTFNAGNANGRFICLRGMDINANSNGVNGWHMLACKIAAPTSVATFSTLSASGSIVAFNRFNSPAAAGGGWQIASVDTTGAVYACNVQEWTSSTASVGVGVSRDADTSNTSHIIMWNNTDVGGLNAGRENLFYDEKASAYRSHKLMSVVGNIFAQINTKSDQFTGNRGTPGDDATSHVGNWSFGYGVGCRGNFSLFIDANGGGYPSFKQDYPGRNTSIGTGALTSTINNPGFVTALNVSPSTATTVTAGPTYVAGTAGGDYRLANSGSAPAGIVSDAVLAYTLDGVARPATNDDAGALSRAA